MDNLSQNLEGNNHLPKDQFLPYVDGELAPKQTAYWKSHLDACWSCRVRVGKTEETIANIIEFEETVMEFQISNSSHRWKNFDSMLKEVSQETNNQSIRTRLFGIWKQMTNFHLYSLTGKLAFSSLAILLIFAIVYQFIFVSPVSASELLNRSTLAETEKLQATAQPVVYQKSKVTTNNKSATLEVWGDVKVGQNKRTIAAELEANQILHDFEAVLRQNNLNPLRPLSAESYRNWSNRFSEKQETVTKTKTSDNEDALELSTKVLSSREIGEITQANLIVRAADWHSVGGSIYVKTADSTKVYEISELEFQVVERASLPKDFFGNQVILSKEVPNIPGKPSPSPVVSPSPGESPETIVGQNQPTTETPATPVASNVPANKTASVELEVEVLGKLNQVNALTGEQIELSRTGDGRLLLKGIVDSKQRKNEILQALAEYANNPGVKIEIQSPDEIKVKPNKKTEEIVVEGVEVSEEKFPVEDELTKYFINQRGMSTEQAKNQIKQLSGNVLANSSQARSSALAMKQMAARFAKTDLEKMDETARSRWRNMIANQARTVQRSLQNLKQQLGGVFPTSAAEGAAETTPANDEAIINATKQLFDLAIRTDDGFRRSFSLSNGNQTAPIQSSEFWRSLGKAEKIAAQLANIK